LPSEACLHFRAQPDPSQGFLEAIIWPDSLPTCLSPLLDCLGGGGGPALSLILQLGPRSGWEAQRWLSVHLTFTPSAISPWVHSPLHPPLPTVQLCAAGTHFDITQASCVTSRLGASVFTSVKWREEHKCPGAVGRAEGQRKSLWTSQEFTDCLQLLSSGTTQPGLS
jgi:hypothetical protein